MKTLSVFVLGIILWLPGAVLAQPLPWQNFNRVGQATLKFLFWSVYDADLFSAAESFDVSADNPFALSLTYRRDFTAEQLVEETQRQWQAMGVNARASWVSQLRELLPDVGKADTITLYVDGNTSTFFLNQTRLGTIADAGFSKSFAAIWLSEKTTRPYFRQQLLGIEQ
jgi:hypothetical protein